MGNYLPTLYLAESIQINLQKTPTHGIAGIYSTQEKTYICMNILFSSDSKHSIVSRDARVNFSIPPSLLCLLHSVKKLRCRNEPNNVHLKGGRQLYTSVNKNSNS